MPPSSPPPRPTPRALSGRGDPAARVRPVDWTATGARKPAEGAEAAAGSAGAATGSTAAREAASAGGSAAAPAGPPSAPLPRRRLRTVELPRPAASAPPTYADRPLRIVEEDLRVVGAQDATQEQIILAVADPEDAWTADAGVSDHFQRGPLTVQVRRLDNAVIGVFATRYALSVRPEEFERTPETAMLAAGPSARRGLGTRHPTTRRELLARMEEAGFVIASGSTHGRVSHPDHPGLFVPMASTPSDVRFTRHAVAQIRRVFGIDLRR